MKINFFEKLKDLFFPKGLTCNICGCEIYDEKQRYVSLCKPCMESFEPPESFRAEYKGISVYSAVKYNAVARKYVLDYKDGGKPYIAEYIAKFMADIFKEVKIKPDIVCFVPSHKTVERRRGYDAMKEVALFFCKITDLPLSCDLVKIRKTEDQSLVKEKDREQNVEGCFDLNGGVFLGKNVLLLDDLVTSGATISACAETLCKKGKAKSVSSLTFAKA